MSDFTLADYKIQAYLLANADEIAERTGRLSGQTTNPQNFFIKKAVNDNNASIQNLNELLANSLTEKEKITFVDTLPSLVKNNLAPYVNIYKTFVDGDKEVDIRLKPGRVEPKFVRSAGTSQIEGTNELSNPGVNIESVEIVRLGGNPAEIDTNITFRLTLRALRLGHYFDRQISTSENTRKNFTGDIPQSILNQLAAGVAWIDLIKMDLFEQETIKSNPQYNAVQNQLFRFGKQFGVDFRETLFEEAMNGNIYDDLKTKIKVEIGYEPLTQEQLESIGVAASDLDRIQQAIEGQKQVFFLNLVQNEIGYDTKDGAQISIDFVAAGAMSTTTRKTDLLFDPNFFENELRLNDQRCKILETMPHVTGGYDFATREEQLSGQANMSTTRPTIYREGNALPAIIIDPFVDDFSSAILPGGVIATQAEARGLAGDHEVSILSFYEESVKTGQLDSDEAKSDALNKIQNSADKLGQIQRNLLINGLYGAAQLVANNESGAEVTGYDPRQVSHAQPGANELKSRVYMHFAKTDHVLNYISSFLSPIGDGNRNPYIQNFGDLYFFRESDLPGATDTAIYRRQLNQYVEDLGNAQSEEELLEGLTDDDVPNIIDGDEVQIEFTFLGDIIETALEVLASNNRLGEGSPTNKDKILKRSENLIYAGNNVDEVAKTAFVKPFYWADGVEVRLVELQKLLGDIVMSDVTYQSPADPNTEITINLADLPISMLEYKKWFANNIGGTRRTNFFIKDYINNLLRWVSRLVGDAVNHNRNTTTNREPPELVNNKVFLNKKGDTILPAQRGFPGAPNSADQSISAVSMTKIAELANAQDQSLLSPRIMTILSQTPAPALTLPLGSNRKARDREQNIPHIIINDSGNGALRRINFAREDMPGLREARLFQGEDFGGTSLLREKYNAQIEFEGNNFFKPGSVLYVEPGAIDLGYTNDKNSFARQLGLGGYYYVIRVTHSLYFAGKLDWQTSVDTKWTSFGDEFSFTPDPDPRPDKCTTSYLARYANAKTITDPSEVQQIFDVMNELERQYNENRERNR
jgi:hypothetical protein